MFQRGFKTWAEEMAIRVRRDLGKPVTAPLEAGALATHLRVKLLSPNDLPSLDASVRMRLLTVHASVWSAFSLQINGGWAIVFNPSHSPRRTANDITHELAHILLNHIPGRMLMSPSGACLRSYDRTQEDEANWLAGSLLLPRQALLACRLRRMTNAEIATTYGVSEDLVKYRLNVSGVDVQVMRRVKSSRGNRRSAG